MGDMQGLSCGEAAAYLNTILQQHILQGGALISQEQFLAIDTQEHFTWRYHSADHAMGDWTHYDVRYSRDQSTIAVHASSSKDDELGGDRIHIPSTVTAQRLLSSADTVFRSMLQLKVVAEHNCGPVPEFLQRSVDCGHHQMISPVSARAWDVANERMLGSWNEEPPYSRPVRATVSNFPDFGLEPSRHTGRVKWVKASYGFITHPGIVSLCLRKKLTDWNHWMPFEQCPSFSEDLFYHESEVKGTDMLNTQDHVGFLVVRNSLTGKLNAISIRLLHNADLNPKTCNNTSNMLNMCHSLDLASPQRCSRTSASLPNYVLPEALIFAKASSSVKSPVSSTLAMLNYPRSPSGPLYASPPAPTGPDVAASSYFTSSFGQCDATQALAFRMNCMGFSSTQIEEQIEGNAALSNFRSNMQVKGHAVSVFGRSQSPPQGYNSTVNALEEREGYERYFESTQQERIVRHVFSTPGRDSNQMTVTVTPHSRLANNELTSSLANIPNILNYQHKQLLSSAIATFDSADSGNVEQRKEPRYFKTKLCKYFPSSGCPRGSRCWFAHSPEEIRQPIVT